MNAELKVRKKSERVVAYEVFSVNQKEEIDIPNFDVDSGHTNFNEWVRVYEDVCETCKNINSVFGGPAISLVAFSMMKGTLLLFHGFTRYLEVEYAIFLIFSNFLELWILLYCCDSVVIEVSIFVVVMECFIEL